MTAFEFFSVALSFVLGLGLTRLLLGGISVFRARRRQKIHWIPVAWALSIFIFQIQYWWAVFELNALLDTWTHWRFLTLLVAALLLFIAGALILPAAADHEREHLIEYFDQDGRWALLAIAAYAAVSMWANWFLFAMSPISTIGAFVVAFGLVASAAFLAKNRRIQGSLTATFLVMSILAYIVLAPPEY